MSTTTIVFRFNVNGSPADVTSAVLRDPTNAFGVRRVDTGATVVAAGTALTHQSTGTYTHAFADPAPGLVYNYWVEAVYNGVTYRFEKNLSGPPAATSISRSYLTVTAADALAALVPAAGLVAWNAAAADARTRALEQASAEVDDAMPYQGRKYAEDQPLQFPRVAYESSQPAGAAEVVWDWDEAAEQAVAPRDVLLAVVYQADAILAGTREPRLSAQHDGVVYDLTGTIAESYKQTEGPGVMTGLCRPAWMLLR